MVATKRTYKNKRSYTSKKVTMAKDRKPMYKKRTQNRKGGSNRVVKDYHGEQLPTRKITYTARPVSTRTLVNSALEPQWYRVQGLNRFALTTGGFYGLKNATTATGDYILPVHVWDLTSIINLNAPGSANISPNVGFTLYNNTAGESYAHTLSSVTEAGTTVNNCNLLFENTSYSSRAYDDPLRKSFHEYSHIKMMLYGTLNRPTKYLIQIVKFKDGEVDPLWAAGTNAEKKKLFHYLASPYMTNMLEMGTPQAKQYVKVIKTYSVTIDRPTEYGEVLAGLPKHLRSQELNIFLPHNRVRRYDWIGASTPIEPDGTGFDQDNGVGFDTRTDPRNRLYLMIRALVPTEEISADGLETTVQRAPIVDYQPSYDLILRQKHQVPV